jgi:hypothetical protein
MNPAYLLFSALAFLIMKAKKPALKITKGLPPAAKDDRDEPEHLLDSERVNLAFLRDSDDSILDSVWEGHGVESDASARDAADYVHQQVIDAGYHPLVADARALETYDTKGGQAPDYIKAHQGLIGARETGIYDEQTEDRIELIVSLVDGGDIGLPGMLVDPRDVPSSRPSAKPPTVIDAKMFELKESDDWDLTPTQRKNHAAARKLAIKEYQKARANGQSHEVGAAMWLGVYMKAGGDRKATIGMMQRECGMPSSQQTSVWDENTRNWVRRITSDYRQQLATKKK